MGEISFSEKNEGEISANFYLKEIDSIQFLIFFLLLKKKSQPLNFFDFEKNNFVRNNYHRVVNNYPPPLRISSGGKLFTRFF